MLLPATQEAVRRLLPAAQEVASSWSAFRSDVEPWMRLLDGLLGATAV